MIETRLTIDFEGWFQCRLATNPDPTDEPRGVSGHTFALPGEPDLDRIIRFQDPVAPRSHGPRVGVKVTKVRSGQGRVDDHPLCGARVTLLDQPKFESRNLLLTGDRGGAGLIHPFHLELADRNLTLRRLDLVDPENPDLELQRVAPERLNRRAPVDLAGMVWDPERVAAATGIPDPLAYRAARKASLEADLVAAEDPHETAALGKRIRDLAITDPKDLRLITLQVTQTRRFAINGPSVIVDDDKRSDPVDTVADWPIEFWMGGWDSDALCGYIVGHVTIPLATP